MTPPLAVGRPTGVSGDGKQFVFYRDATGAFNVLWWSDNRWRHRTVPGPPVAGNIAAYYWYSAWHAFYRDTGGRIQEVYTSGDEVRRNDLLTAAIAPPAVRAETDPTALTVGPIHYQHAEQKVLFASGGHIHELRWDGAWRYTDLHLLLASGGVTASPAGTRAPCGIGLGNANVYVTYAVPGDQLRQLHLWRGNGVWTYSDLGPYTIAGGLAAALLDNRLLVMAAARPPAQFVLYPSVVTRMLPCDPVPPLAMHTRVGFGAFHVFDGTPRIFFRNSFDQLVEYWQMDTSCYQFRRADVLGQGSGAPSVTSGPCVWALGSGEHVAWTGVDGHVHELYWDGSRWKHNDLHLAAS